MALRRDAPVAEPLPPVAEDALQAPEQQPIEALSASPFEVQELPAPETAAQASDEGSPIAFNLRPRTPSGRFRKKGRTPEPVLALVGLVGLAVFAAGVFWGFNAKASERLPLLADPVTAGWGLGLLGVGLAASSVYFLLSRLGSKGD